MGSFSCTLPQQAKLNISCPFVRVNGLSLLPHDLIPPQSLQEPGTDALVSLHFAAALLPLRDVTVMEKKKQVRGGWWGQWEWANAMAASVFMTSHGVQLKAP